MEYALRAIPPDQEVLVSITQMLELGEDVTRDNDYRCPGDNCGVPLFPAIPEREKEGRVFAPRPYFRAGQSHPHVPGCLGDGAVRVDEVGVPTDRSKIVTPTSDAVLADYPVRFNERRRSSNGGEVTDTVGGDGTPTTRGGRTGGESGGGTRPSERSTSQLSELVRIYEAFPADLSQLPLRIQECPARNFAEAFRSVRQAVDREGRPAARHIYYGSYDRHRDYNNSGSICIFFTEQAVDRGRKPFSVWIEAGLGPESVKQNLLARLEQAQAGAEAVVYVLGSFHLHQGYKYTVEIPGLNYVYVSLSEAQQP